MYPIPERELQGWKTNLISCGNTTLLVQADAQTIAWGMGPLGQLGFGAGRKSSAKADIVRALDGITIRAIGCCATHTFFLAVQSPKTNALPAYLPSADPDEEEESSEEPKPKKGAAKKATTKAATTKKRAAPAPANTKKPTKKSKT